MPRSSRRNARAHPVGPLGGVAQTRRKVPFARLIDRRVCAFARPHLRQRSPPWLVDQLRWSGDGVRAGRDSPAGPRGANSSAPNWRSRRTSSWPMASRSAGSSRLAPAPGGCGATRPPSGGHPDRCRRQLAVLAWPGHSQPRAPAAGAGRPGRLTPPESTHPMGLPVGAAAPSPCRRSVGGIGGRGHGIASVR